MLCTWYHSCSWYVHGMFMVCSWMFMHVKFWLPQQVLPAQDQTVLRVGDVCERVEGVGLLPCLERVAPAVSVSHSYKDLYSNVSNEHLPKDIIANPVSGTAILTPSVIPTRPQKNLITHQVKIVRRLMDQPQASLCYSSSISGGLPYPIRCVNPAVDFTIVY